MRSALGRPALLVEIDLNCRAQRPVADKPTIRTFRAHRPPHANHMSELRRHPWGQNLILRRRGTSGKRSSLPAVATAPRPAAAVLSRPLSTASSSRPCTTSCRSRLRPSVRHSRASALRRWQDLLLSALAQDGPELLEHKRATAHLQYDATPTAFRAVFHTTGPFNATPRSDSQLFTHGIKGSAQVDGLSTL